MRLVSRTNVATRRCSGASGPRVLSSARRIASAVASRHPRARYLVGVDAQALNLLNRVTPTAVKDRVTRLTLGL